MFVQYQVAERNDKLQAKTNIKYRKNEEGAWVVVLDDEVEPESDVIAI